MDTQKETIGFVGVGLMGHGMATNILKAGYPLTVIGHRNRHPVNDLVNNGAGEAITLRELGEACSIVHICAPGSPQVEAIVAGLAQGLKPGSVIIDCSTADPGSTAMLAQKMAKQDVAYADAPLGGTPVQAAEGSLSAMVGAQDETFQRINPVITTWAKAIVHIGGVGDGHRMKLLNNFLSMG